MFGNGEVHARFPKQNENGGYEEVAEIVDKVIGKEIDIDKRAQHDAQNVMVVIFHLHLHHLP